MRIGFLFNHYTAHQVLHAAPTAFALSRRPVVTVEIVVSTPHLARVAERLGALYPGHRTVIRQARVPAWAEALDPLVRRHVFLKKAAVLKANTGLFAGYDVLVVPEKTSLKLKRAPRLAHLKFVHSRHGAGDRAVGFDPRSTGFDLILASGRKICDRLGQLGVPAERCAVIGYPKFSVAGALGQPPAFADPARPTVLYNPHFERSLSSWPRWGSAVLDHFKHGAQHNLIFAPHVVLYERPWRHRARSLRRWRRRPNLHLDRGSLASIDMTYTETADIYLGDVSSQVYEFLRRPRPCVFLNATGHRGWRDDPNYRFWHAGEVVDDIAELPAALARAPRRHTEFKAVQDSLFAASFDLNDVPSEERAAAAILDLLGAGREEPAFGAQARAV